MKTLGRVLSVVIVVFAWESLAFAQVTSAVLQGVVTDRPGRCAAWRHRHRHQHRDRARPRGGHPTRSASSAPPRCRPAHTPFARRWTASRPIRRTGLVLTVGQTATVDMQLGSGDAHRSGDGEATAPLVDTTSNALGTTVTNAQLDDLPLAGRDFAALARLAPGVTGVGQRRHHRRRTADPQQQRRRGRHQQRRAGHRQHARQLLARVGARVRGLHQSVRGRARPGGRRPGERRHAIGHQHARRAGCSRFHRDDALDAQNPFSKAQGSGTAPFSEQRGGGFLGGPFIKNTLALLRIATSCSATRRPTS